MYTFSILAPPSASMQSRMRCAATVHGLRRTRGGRTRQPRPQPSKQHTSSACSDAEADASSPSAELPTAVAAELPLVRRSPLPAGAAARGPALSADVDEGAATVNMKSSGLASAWSRAETCARREKGSGRSESHETVGGALHKDARVAICATTSRRSMPLRAQGCCAPALRRSLP